MEWYYVSVLISGKLQGKATRVEAESYLDAGKKCNFDLVEIGKLDEHTIKIQKVGGDHKFYKIKKP